MSELIWLPSTSLLLWPEFWWTWATLKLFAGKPRGLKGLRGSWGSGSPHAPAHGARKFWGIILGAKSLAGELSWAGTAPRQGSSVLPSSSPVSQHGVSGESLRGHPGLGLPHLPVLVPCCNFMGREEAGLTPRNTVSANSCRQVSSPDSKM